MADSEADCYSIDCGGDAINLVARTCDGVGGGDGYVAAMYPAVVGTPAA